MADRYKYPYIPYEYYSATFFAIKMINQGQQIWNACYRSAKYYKVNKDELQKHVEKRLAIKEKREENGYLTIMN